MKSKKHWTVEFDERAVKELKRLGKQAQRIILNYLRERIATDKTPRRFGKALGKELTGLWRYRVSDYRIVCQIEDQNVTVLVIRIGHRKDVYK